MGQPAFSTLSYVLQSIAHQRLPVGLLDVFLRLFNGHDIPALFWARERRPGFYKSPGINRSLIYEAHLLGAVLAGSYPFKGVALRCDCKRNHHVCDGHGSNYLCIDLDAKRGETDMEERIRNLLTVCWRAGLLPVVFASRSGNGAHVYVFLDAVVTTREAFRAVKVLTSAAGITDRVDIIPSGEHYKGFGTLHALPLSPMSEEGGGHLFDSNLRPVFDMRTVVGLLQWADMNRSASSLVRRLASGEVTPPALPGAVVRRPRAPKVVNREKKAKKADRDLLKMMRLRHPQFRAAIATAPEKWRGKRSSRDAYLVGYMRRQGMGDAGIVEALLDIPKTKAAERGSDYAWDLVAAVATWEPAPKLILAGQILRAAQAKAMRLECPWGPWAARQAPPLSYDGVASPWWRDGVQERVRRARSRVDGILLAYLIDRYYRGPVQRRLYYASQRGLAKELGFPARTLSAATCRLAERFPDVLRTVAGVSHPRLRIAHGFYVPEACHKDRLDWYLAPGRGKRGTLPCTDHVSQNLAPRDGGNRPVVSERSHSTSHPVGANATP